MVELNRWRNRISVLALALGRPPCRSGRWCPAAAPGLDARRRLQRRACPRRQDRVVQSFGSHVSPVGPHHRAAVEFAVVHFRQSNRWAKSSRETGCPSRRMTWQRLALLSAGARVQREGMRCGVSCYFSGLSPVACQGPETARAPGRFQPARSMTAAHTRDGCDACQSIGDGR